jgi:hypothetical protein
MKRYWVIAFLSIVFVVQAADIKTNDGTVYKNAVIEAINPSGLDIGYTDNNGNFVLRGIKFDSLPADIQKKYGYKPEHAEKFDKKISEYQAVDMDTVAINAKTRVENIMKEIKAKLNGADINIAPEDINFATFALRSSVKLMPTSTIRQGCVAEIQEVTSGKTITAKQIILDGTNLPNGVCWSGFIYPTGIKANYRGTSGIPVFAGTAQRAVGIVNKYLNIYGSYAAQQSAPQNQPESPDTAAPSQIEVPDNNNLGIVDDAGTPDDKNMLETKQRSATPPQPVNNNLNIVSDACARDSHRDQTAAVKTYFLPYYLAPEDNYEYSYYLGSYYPVDWYRKNDGGRPMPPAAPAQQPDRQGKVIGGNSGNNKVGNFYKTNSTGAVIR